MCSASCKVPGNIFDRENPKEKNSFCSTWQGLTKSLWKQECQETRESGGCRKDSHWEPCDPSEETQAVRKSKKSHRKDFLAIIIAHVKTCQHLAT